MRPSKASSQVDFKIWDDAGRSLIGALEGYRDLCFNLVPNFLGERANPNDLAARADLTLETLSDQLARTHAMLARTRNRLVSPLLRLPREIVSSVLVHVIFERRDPQSESFDHLPMKYRLMEPQLWRIQYRLHEFLGVCSMLTDIIRTEGKFWSMIPMIGNYSIQSWQPLQHSLQRSTGCTLYLAADDEIWYYSSKDLPKVVADFSPRFYAINLNLKDFRVIKEAMNVLLESDRPESLTELSIRLNQESDKTPVLPGDSDYIIPRDHPQWDTFTDILGVLTSFRVSGIHLHWDSIGFSTRLVELLVHNINLGYDDAIAPFLRSISSASNLRDLKLTSVNTLRRPDAARNVDTSSPVLLPNLKSLLLHDLYLNTLESLLPLIIPGSHSTTLFLTDHCLENNILEGTEPGVEETQTSKLDNLCAVLKPSSVDTLTLSNRQRPRNPFLDGPKLHTLLKALPRLKTLKLDKWDYNYRYPWSAITRPEAARVAPEVYSFPALENLHLTSAKICSTPVLLMEAVASHPLQRIVLGGSFETTGFSYRSGKLIEERCDPVAWFRSKVPEFHFVDSSHRPPELYSSMWRLW